MQVMEVPDTCVSWYAHTRNIPISKKSRKYWSGYWQVKISQCLFLGFHVSRLYVVIFAKAKQVLFFSVICLFATRIDFSSQTHNWLSCVPNRSVRFTRIQWSYGQLLYRTDSLMHQYRFHTRGQFWPTCIVLACGYLLSVCGNQKHACAITQSLV